MECLILRSATNPNEGAYSSLVVTVKHEVPGFRIGYVGFVVLNKCQYGIWNVGPLTHTHLDIKGLLLNLEGWSDRHKYKNIYNVFL